MEKAKGRREKVEGGRLESKRQNCIAGDHHLAHLDAMARWVKIATGLAMIVCVLGVVSYYTSPIIYADGGYPTAELRIEVNDRFGKPVPGAKFRVYEPRYRMVRQSPFVAWLDGRPPELKIRWHGVEDLSPKELVSDTQGRLAFVHFSDLEISVDYRYLFWCIPVPFFSSERDFEIKADGFQPLQASLNSLFIKDDKSQSASQSYRVIRDGQDVEVPVYTHTLSLSR
jgi:hypothetical protein